MAVEIRFVQNLSEDEKNRVQMLEERCKGTKNIHFKLDPQSLVGDDDGLSHVLYEDHGALEGYIAVNCFNGEEMECTAVVDGNEGIFMDMYKTILERAKEKGISKLLFIIDRNDIQSTGWVKDLGLCLSHMEYRMVFDESRFKPDQKGDIVIQDAGAGDFKTISYLDNYFIKSQDDAEEKEPELRDIKNVKIARLDNEVIGKIKVEDVDGTVDLYGFVVSPSRRGEGLGRKTLNYVIKGITETDYKKIYPEVDSENHIALNLYKSVGFDIQAEFDYYEYTM